MENLENLEEKVMLLLHTVRKHQEESTRLRAAIAEKEEELETARREKEALERTLDEYKKLADENEALKNQQNEARDRVEKILNKLEKFQSELEKGESAQAELMPEEEGA
jgi:DNA repair exonuclease SbcCD ATPase subunit